MEDSLKDKKKKNSLGHYFSGTVSFNTKRPENYVLSLDKEKGIPFVKKSETPEFIWKVKLSFKPYPNLFSLQTEDNLYLCLTDNSGSIGVTDDIKNQCNFAINIYTDIISVNTPEGKWPAAKFSDSNIPFLVTDLHAKIEDEQNPEILEAHNLFQKIFPRNNYCTMISKE